MNGISRACWMGIALSTLGLAQSNFSVYQPSGVVATPTMVLVSTPFCSPGSLISPPLNLPRQILQFSPSGGTPTVFSDLNSLPNANIQCTTDGMAGFDSYLVMSQCTCGGFSQGDVFVQLNNQIYKIPPAGGTPVLFSTLPEYLHGMTFDPVGTFGYNLVVLTHNAHTGGAVYTVDSKGKVTGPLISQSTELTNPLVAPFNYGSIKQGDLLIAGYDGNIYDMTPSSTGTGYTLNTFATGFSEPEGIDFIPQNIITFYNAIQGPTDSDEMNEQNPNPSYIDTFGPSFFSGYSGKMLVRNESFQPTQPGGTIYAVDAAGVKKSLGDAPGEQEGAMFLTTNVSLLCPAGTGQLGTAYSSAVVASGGTAPYTYKLTSGSLPPGLTLNAQTGAIAGTPTTAGTYSFTIQAQDSTGKPAGLAVLHCCITISPASLAATCPANSGTVGVAYSSSVAATGGVPPYTFSVSKGALPAGLSLNASTGAVTGTPTQAGTSTFGIKVVDSTGAAVAISCSITISAPTLTLTCPAGTGQVGVAYSSALVATGGTSPYTFSIKSGLPPGLSLNTSTGAIIGTPTTNGTYSFSATVTDSAGKTTTITCSITIAPAALTLTCPSGTGQVGIAYSSSLTATGGLTPYTFSISSGSLPNGLTLNATTGAITGTPTKSGTFSFTATVTDSTGATHSATCSITIAPPTLSLTCPTGTGQVGTPYQSALTATGGTPPYTFSISSGALPGGLTLNASTGAITGTPTTAGTFSFSGTVTDSVGVVATKSCTITIAPPPLTLTCPVGTGQVGVAYSSALVAGGGTPPYTFSIAKGLPPGLALNTSTGAITGIPTTNGTYSFSATVTDSAGKTTTISCSITIAPANLTLSCPASTAQVGIAYSSALIATGGVTPYTFSISSGALPAGLTLNTSTGAITGIPSKSGTFTFGATVTDSTRTAATTSCTITVSNSTLSLTCPATSGQVGVAYSSALTATGGTPPYTFKISSGSLPAGLTLNASSGAITGTPTTAGTFSFSATVTDSSGVATATISCMITIAPAQLTLTCPVATGQVGVAYSSALTASGGTPPYKFSISGSLPAGLTLNTSTGAITGTPSTRGASTFSATVTDSAGMTATISCTITIAPPTLTLSCPTNTAQVGIPYSSALTASGGVPAYTFSISSGALPPGLTINTSTGAITGQPTTSGAFTFGATVTDSTGTKTTVSCTITVSKSTLSLSCPAGNGQVGIAYSSALAASGGTAPYTYTIASGVLPNGLTLNASTGAITGTPTTSGTFTFGAEVTDAHGVQVTSSCTITISQSTLSLTCPTATGQVGVAYSSALTATGGTPPYTFGIGSGALPGGLTLNTSTGAITGTPKTGGTFSFTATVTDSGGVVVTKSCSIVIAPPTLTLNCPTGTGQVGVSYSSSLTASGGVPPYTFSVSGGGATGPLPPGLTLNTITGAITGIPTNYGTYSFNATVTDSKGKSTTISCSITIAPAQLTLSCPTGTAQVGISYSSALTATGGETPYTFSISSGALPAGLKLNPSTGAITGIPTTAGSFTFSATVSDSTGTTATMSCTIRVAKSTLSLTCPAATGQVGVAYSSALTASGGTAPYAFSISSGSLPNGLTLNASTGAIAGTPSMAGTFSFSAQVTDAEGVKVTVKCTITITSSNLTLNCPGKTGQVGVAYSSALTATGGTPPYTFSISNGSLPAGLTLNTSTGAITGTPTTAGTSSFSATVTDSSGVATVTINCSITIAPAQLTLTCPASTGQVGVAYSSALTAGGGTPPYTFSISGSLPAGLTLNTSTGAITGTPNTRGASTFNATVTDSAGKTATISCTITINPAALTLTCPTGTAQVGAPYSSALMASGGVPAYTFSISSGTLPTGLTLNTSTGAITGQPTKTGTFTFSATVTDSTGTTATVSCTITVSKSTLTLTCPATTGTVGIAYSSALTASGGTAPYTYSIASGVLPNGLTLNASTGRITGTPTTSGTFSFGAEVTDARGVKFTTKCTITISPSTLSLTCPTGTGVVGVAYSSALTASGGTAPYTFSISGFLPVGLTLNTSTGAITGTPTTAGTSSFSATVTDAAGVTFTIKCSIVIAPPLSLTCPTANGQVGITYSSALVASGGTPPYTFSVGSAPTARRKGTSVSPLPPGLTLNTSTGAITGVPTSYGNFSFTATVTDSAGNTATITCTISISPGTLTLSCPANSAQVGIPYSSALTPAGGQAPYTFSISSAVLPPGLTLNTSTGAITGVPSSAGSFTFGATVTDSTGTTVTISCTITVSTSTLSLSCPTKSGQVGTSYSSALSASGGTPPYTYNISKGSLPPGLKLTASTGAIQGTPTNFGTFSFTAIVTDSEGVVFSTKCTITIAPPPLTLACPGNFGQVGAAYSSALTASGGEPPYTFSVSGGGTTTRTHTSIAGLPPGLTLNTSTGAITGVPTTPGTYSFTAIVTDSTNNSTSISCSITIVPAALTLSCPADSGQLGAHYISALTANGGVPPYTFSVSSAPTAPRRGGSTNPLPPGLTLDTSTGEITGIPTMSGTYSFIATVTDSTGTTVNTTCSITIGSAQLTVSCAASSGVEGQPYNSSVSAAGGTAPYTFSITGGGLPTGLSLNPSTGAITGTPTAAATFTFRVTVTDSGGLSASSGCIITIEPPGTPLSLSCPNTGQVGSTYDSGVVAFGGIPPYTFAITSGSLPPGLIFSTTTGNITGIPTTAGTYSVTFQVTDSAIPADTAMATCAVIIAPAGALSDCVPSSSLSVLVQGSVATAYIPNGSWSETGVGVEVVPIEGPASPRAFIDTAGNPVNSCSSNWVTGTTVCSGNGSDVYIINGSTLSATVNSSGFGLSYFSGGDCLNCGVAINAATNQAVIETSAGAGVGGMQFLDLTTNTFEPLISVPQFTSENIAVDPVLNIVLSPNEGYNASAPDFQILQFIPGTTTNQLYSMANFTSFGGQNFDSAGLDCTTHIAVGTEEYTGMLSVFDLTQAVYNPGSSTWTAPAAQQEFPEFDNLSAGTSGMAVAPGSHVAIIAGEFGGNEFGVIQLPSNSGTGTPSVLDYVAAYLPNEPNGNFFENGLDPHTVTAYVSPNSGKALGLLVDDPRSYVALIDLQGILNAPRQAGTHYIDPSVDLVATGLLTFISIPTPNVLCPTGAWDQNQPYSSSFVASGLVPPDTFSITGSLPPGLSLNDATGIITGTPTAIGNYSFGVKVTDSVGTVVSSSCSIAIEGTPSILCPAPRGTAGQPYSSSAAVTGGAPPYSFYISSGALPTGLTLDSSTGAITGTPMLKGTYSFTVTVQDATGNTATTSDCGITIAGAPLSAVVPLSTGQLTVTYFSQVATGGTPPYTISLATGSLPPGVTANSSGNITGIPTAPGTYHFTIQIRDSAGATARGSASTIIISALSPSVLSSCQGANALSVLAQGTFVNAYVANGSWTELNSGIQIVPLEGSGTSLTSIPTSNEVSSCASNWVTGQTVCTGNNNEVYLVSGSTLTNTLTAGGFGDQYFQDGSCLSCGVTIDASTNQATIEVATGFESGGVQQLNLSSNTFAAPLTLPGGSAESVGLDPIRHWVLSPNQGVYGPPDFAIVQNQPVTTPFDFASISSYFGSNDYLAAGAEDCTTGIALATQQFSADMLVTDLSQATFDPVGQQWNAPAQVQSFPEFSSLQGGPNGLAIAGGSHLGLVTGVYCCSPGFAAIQMPSVSGSGTPSVTDYVVANFPNDPSGNSWQNSQGPVLVSAYVSPNTGKALGVAGNDARSYLALIDLQALLAAPRQAGSHNIDPSVDLVGTGILTWVSSQTVTLTCPENEWVTGTAYSFAVTAKNGTPPYTFSLTGGVLPDGLNMDSSGNIAGTPTATGSFTFTVQAVDSSGTAAGTASISCTITIAAPLALTPPAASGQAGLPYSSTVGVTGGFPPYTLSINSGSLPPGLTLNTSTGAITGNPTTAGVYNFQVNVADSSGTAVGNITGNFTITIAGAALITSCPLNTAVTSIMYFSQVATGGAAPYTISVSSGSLPPGLSTNTTSVVGIPTTNGASNFALQVMDSSGNTATASGCSITVSGPHPNLLAACQPANNISVLAQGSNVNAYFPAGSWDEYNNNIYVVPLEGSGSLATIPTAGPVNSCASNWRTGQTVCVDSNNEVYLITGSTVTNTLGDSSFGFNYNYEGTCYSCGVMIDPGTNKAAIAMALGYGTGTAVQFLDLGTSTFENPIPVNIGNMETAAMDPLRHSVLISATYGTPNPIVQTEPATGVFYQNPINYYNDSAAEDCTTGIALSTTNYDNALTLSDLSQGFFDPIMGTWSAPSQSQSTPEFGSLVDGPSGIAIAGGSHLGVVTGEFCCGPGFGAISLPATSGNGTPALVDYVEANFPNDPSGAQWYNGLAPHTVTAYVSPNNGKAYGVAGNDGRTYLAVIDLQALLNAPRQAGTHYIDPSVDLVGSGILTWVLVQ